MSKLVRLCLFVFLVPLKSWSYEERITYSGGDLIGNFKINGIPSLDSNRTDVAERVRFNFGLVISHIGLPNYLAVCGASSFTAASFQHTIGVSGFNGMGDSVWSSATIFPDTLTRLDSIIDPYPQLTGRNRYLGDGLIHSRNQGLFNCGGSQFATQPRYNRIIFYRINSNLFAKIQIIGFEFTTATCFDVRSYPCNISKNVIFKYHITNNQNGIFNEPPIAINLNRNKIFKIDHLKWKKWIYNILGRNIKPAI